jgi:hypothetical protein
MRIFNGTNSQINLPLSGNTRLSIAPKAVSQDFMPTNEFIALIVTTYDEKEIALVLGGRFEMSMCAAIPASTPLLVQDLDEAVKRFSPKQEENKVEVNPVPDNKKEDVVAEDVAQEKGEEDGINDAPVVEAPKAKSHKSASKKKD